MTTGFGVPVTEQSNNNGLPTMIDGFKLVISKKRGGSEITENMKKFFENLKKKKRISYKFTIHNICVNFLQINYAIDKNNFYSSKHGKFPFYLSSIIL